MTEYLLDNASNSVGVLIEHPTVMTIGTFDGLHRGHRKVIGKIRDRAKTVGKKSLLLTFRPHPLSVLSPQQAPLLLATYEEKRTMLAECGLDYVVFLDFDSDLASCDPESFVKDILVKRLGLSELVVGYDHRFGRERAGDADLLNLLGSDLGFSVEVMLPVQSNGNPISSSLIRKAIACGDVRSAKEYLGKPYALIGNVVTGKKRGRELGFPTANIEVRDGIREMKLIPLEGVYAVSAEVDSERYMGALHIGPRPTFQEAEKVVELHLLDFSRDIYGKEVRVEFVEHIREILLFDSVSGLVSQMRKDVERVRVILGE